MTITADTTERPHENMDAEERARFSALAAEWWNPDGKFRPLHRFNPVRLSFLRGSICNLLALPTAAGGEGNASFTPDVPTSPGQKGRVGGKKQGGCGGLCPPHGEAMQPLLGLRLLDIGCGGGLLSEPMTRLGAQVTGIDVSAASLAAARLHAESEGLDIAYRNATAADLLKEDARFDVILNMEVVEHVPDPQLLLRQCAELLAPGGLLFVATLNRTLRSFLLAIIGAEYVLRWLPRGTHKWERFLAPEEIRAWLAAAGMETCLQIGMTYKPLRGVWSLSNDCAVNYMLCARKPLAASPQA